MKNCALILSAWSVVALPASVVATQAPVGAIPAFEVATVKPNASGGSRIEITQGRLAITSATLATCIQWAYGLQNSQISGANSAASDQLTSERYDIVAKSNGLVSEDQLKLMLQNLLAERFRLAFHKQTKEARVYVLLVDKSGPRFHTSLGDGKSQQQAVSKLTRHWTWSTMTQLADALSEAMETPVLDQTGLSAKYDFSLDLTPYLPPTNERPDIAAMMVTAIREQLGLKMESRQAPVDVMIVDHLEKPSAN